jgi:hypothetical protein
MNKFWSKNIGILTLLLFIAVLASKYFTKYHNTSIVYSNRYNLVSRCYILSFKILEFWCQYTYFLESKYLYFGVKYLNFDFKIPTFGIKISAFWYLKIFEVNCLHFGIFSISGFRQKD